VVCFKVLTQHLPEGNFGNHKGKIARTCYLYLSIHTHTHTNKKVLWSEEVFLPAIVTACHVCLEHLFFTGGRVHSLTIKELCFVVYLLFQQIKKYCCSLRLSQWWRCPWWSLAPKMEEVSSSKTLVARYNPTHCNNPEDQHGHKIWFCRVVWT
jgi:hypothetical protein